MLHGCCVIRSNMVLPRITDCWRNRKNHPRGPSVWCVYVSMFLCMCDMGQDLLQKNLDPGWCFAASDKCFRSVRWLMRLKPVVCLWVTLSPHTSRAGDALLVLHMFLPKFQSHALWRFVITNGAFPLPSRTVTNVSSRYRPSMAWFLYVNGNAPWITHSLCIYACHIAVMGWLGCTSACTLCRLGLDSHVSDCKMDGWMDLCLQLFVFFA